MTHTPIYAAICQVSNTPNYLMETLEKCPQDKWFEAGLNEYALEFLAYSSIICKRITPIWSNGSFVGNKIEYYWNREMRFEV